MALSYEKLIEFDLLDELDRTLSENANRLIEFFSVFQEIQTTDRFIRDLPSYPDSKDKIIRDEMLSAIGATLAIEGSTLTKEEIEESLQKADVSETLKRKEQEAENSRKVYYFIREIIENQTEEFTYSESLIRQIHKYFTDNMNYPGNVPGDYRGDFPVTYGDPRRKGICRTRSEVEHAMSQFVKWLNQHQSGILAGSGIAKAIMGHFYLSEIHPFGDGNGRTARALEALILYRNYTNHYCFWSLANFWSTKKNEYIAHLGKIRVTCDPWDFLMWGMKGYQEELHRTKNIILTKVKQLMLMDYAKYLLSTKRNQPIKINARIVAVLNLLVHRKPVLLPEFLESPEMKGIYSKVTQNTQYRDLKKLEELKLIKHSKKDRKGYIEANYETLESLRYRV